MDNKQKCIAIIALMLALVAIFLSSEPGTNGINGTNGTSSVMGTLTFALHNTSSDVVYYQSLKMDSVIVADVNKTSRTYIAIPNGQTLLQNWTSLPMGLTLIPAGAVLVHIHARKLDGVAHDDILNYEIGIVNSTGGNFSSVGVSEPTSGLVSTTEQEFDIQGVMLEKIIETTDRMALRLYVNQTGTGALPDITIYMDDLTISRLVIPAIPIDLTGIIRSIGNNTANLNLKVNKSGDAMSGDIIFDDYKGIRSTSIGGVTSGFDVTALRSEMYLNGSYLQMTAGGLLTNNNLNMSQKNITDVTSLSMWSGVEKYYTTTNSTGDTSNTGGFSGYVVYQSFVAPYNFYTDMLAVNIYSTVANGNVRLALYNGNSTEPSTLISESSSYVAHTGINNITIPNTSLTSGNYYWVAMQTENSVIVYYKTASSRINVTTPYGGFPSTAITTAYGGVINTIIYSLTTTTPQTRYCLRVYGNGTLYTKPC